MSSLVSPEVCDFQGWQSYLLLLVFHHPPTTSFQGWHNTMYILNLPTFNHSFSAFTLGGRKGIRPVKTEWWVRVWLSVWSKVQTCIWPSWCHCHSLSLASVKSRLVLPFWYWLTWVVPEKGPLNGCVYVCYIVPSFIKHVNVTIFLTLYITSSSFTLSAVIVVLLIANNDIVGAGWYQNN